ncbi:uncharacterized protein LOC144715304 isoform X2 [Wolffia australiana]
MDERFNLPTSCRQPRSHGTRPRPSRGMKESSVGTTTSSSGDVAQGDEVVQCDVGFIAGGQEGRTDPQLTPCNNGSLVQQDKDRRLSNNTAECPASHLSPGSVVWAKTDQYDFWPAEVMDGRMIPDCDDLQSDGLVLVQLYGVWEYAWVDPVSELSQFDHCYEERTKEPSRAFQEALTQALHRRQSASEQSDENSDKWLLKRHFKLEDDEENCGKGKRARKPKLHFDDLEFPEISVKRVRRTKIMRHLGLIAPAGSPFYQAHKSH